MNEDEIELIIDKINKIKQRINLLKISKLSRKKLVEMMQNIVHNTNCYSRKKLQELYIDNLIKQYNMLEEKLCKVEDIDMIKKYNICICDYHLESLCHDGKLDLIKYYIEKFNIEVDINHIEFALLGRQFDVLIYLLSNMNNDINLNNLYINDDIKLWLNSLKYSIYKKNN